MTEKKGTSLRLVQGVKPDGTKETESEVVGRAIADPAISSALMAQTYQGHILAGGDINANITEVQRITTAVKAGDLSDLEGMLVGQAVALQTISASLAHRAQLQQTQRNLEAFLGLALKAQAQSRATISALVDLKYPRQVAFVKQANIANGPQQVNNGPPQAFEPERSARMRAHGGKLESERIKLLEQNDGQWLDTGTQGAASGADRLLAPMGESDRPKVARRKSKGLA